MSFGFSIGDFLAVIQLANNVRKRLVKAPAQFKATLDEVKGLSNVLRDIEDSEPEKFFNDQEKQRLCTIYQGCRNVLTELEAKLDKYRELGLDTGGVKGVSRRLIQRIKWDETEINDFRPRIAQKIGEFTLFLAAKNNHVVNVTRELVQSTKDVVSLVRATQISSTIREWLKAPDSTLDYNEACKKNKLDGAGLWLIQDPDFSDWFSEENSFLWLHGFAGSGKSVLCSRVIQHVSVSIGPNLQIGIAFFFFTFSDPLKQDVSAMLRALILQLSNQLCDDSAISELYDSYMNATPPIEKLQDCLYQLVQYFGDVYIVLDALDEIPFGNHRMEMLDILNDIRGWSEPGLHIFVTSRNETDIRDELSTAAMKMISMKNDSVAKEITAYIHWHLRNHRRLRKWESYFDKIEDALVSRADGVFRWVECQLLSLEFSRCPRNEYSLDQLLDALPESLDETYRRMLENIGQDDLGYARRILNMLCVSLRPLTVAELSDGVAVELGEHPKFNPKRKLPDAEDIRLLLPGLIEISIETDSAKSTVRIGHFSVQEYLESDRISLHSVNLYAVQRPDAHAQLSCICLTYLLECRPSWGETDEEGSLTRYAMQYWHKHFANADCARYSLNSQILKLFHASEKFQDWAFFSNLDGAGTKRFDIVLPSPLYCASLVGASFAVSALLEESIDVNAAGGKHGTALQAASAAGHEECVRLLLDKGADFEGQSGDGGSPFSLMPVPSPLSVSSERGHYKVVRILLDKAADRNIRLEYGGALLRSSENGHAKVVQLLLDNNAEACTRWLPSALCAASAGGYQETAQLLLDRNTDVNEPYRTDVHIPSSSLAEAHQLYLQLYLTNNVAFHAQSGQFLTALQQAAGHGHLEIVQLLLDRNAEVNYQGGFFGTALQAASARGERQIVQLLLDRNSDVNSRAGFYGTALEVASAQGHREVVQLLLDRGADVNNQSEYYGSALQAASAHGHREIVQLLLDRNADVNSQRGHYGTALQAASAQNHEEIVQMLLKQPALGHREVIRLPAFKLLLAS